MKTSFAFIATAALAFTIGCVAATSQSGPAISDLSGDWIDATATLDPSTTPIYEGDAPLKFEFLHDMRKGDAFTLSAYSMGAHSGTHIDVPMHFVRDGA